MNEYEITHRITTLSNCSIFDKNGDVGSFILNDIEFVHLDFNITDGWTSDYWIATTTIKALDFVESVNDFYKKLSTIIPVIALVSQTYIDYHLDPFFVQKVGSNVAFLRCL